MSCSATQATAFLSGSQRPLARRARRLDLFAQPEGPLDSYEATQDRLECLVLIAAVLVLLLGPVGQPVRLSGDLGRPSGFSSLRSTGTRTTAPAPATTALPP